MLAACGQAGEDSGSWGEEESQAVLGCMDPAANDYNPLATVQDGSCHYSSGHWGVINQTLLVNRHHELELLLEEALSAGANRSAANASVGHCQCSGRTNNAGEGRDCSDIDAGGHWCYTEPGLCDDGERSGSVVDSEWSYLACYPEAEEGEYSITMNCPGETGFLDGSIRCGETVSGSTQLATSHVGTGAGDHVK